MDEVALEALDKTLERCDPEKLSTLNNDRFAQEIADIYAHLDHIHPFYDGNSKTLRAFTKELAIESGHTIDWDINNENQSSKEGLCIARDNSSHNVGVELATSIPKKRLMYETVHALDGKQNMNDIMQKIVSRNQSKVVFTNIQHSIEEVAKENISVKKQETLAISIAREYYDKVENKLEKK